MVAGLGACLSHDRRHEGDPGEQIFCDRFARIAGDYVSERIAEKMPPGAAAVGEHGSDRLLGEPAIFAHWSLRRTIHGAPYRPMATRKKSASPRASKSTPSGN